MPHQVALTVRARVRRGQAGPLAEFLDSLDRDGLREKGFPFETLPVHFARFLVLDAVTEAGGAAIEPSLLFMCDIDSPVDTFWTRLATEAQQGLDDVFARCEGYPESPTVPTRVAFLRARAVPTTTAYINTVGRSVRQVHDEARLRHAVDEFLDGRDWSNLSALEVRDAVRTFVSLDPDLRWALEPPAKPELAWRLKDFAHMILGGALVLAALPILVLAAPLWLVALRTHEIRDVAGTAVPDPAHLARLEEAEDVLVQNQLSAVGSVKQGTFRRVTLIGVLWILSYASRHVYKNGNLAGIRTIHFARWVFLDDKRRLIFASNYDGGIESYMDDFIDKVAFGLNAAFSNGAGYPKTRWLVAGGARDEQAFKNYLRSHQIPTQVWYSAYGDLSARNVADNAAVRAGLRGTLTSAQAVEWARRL